MSIFKFLFFCIIILAWLWAWLKGIRMSLLKVMMRRVQQVFLIISVQWLCRIMVLVSRGSTLVFIRFCRFCSCFRQVWRTQRILEQVRLVILVFWVSVVISNCRFWVFRRLGWLSVRVDRVLRVWSRRFWLFIAVSFQVVRRMGQVFFWVVRKRQVFCCLYCL